MRLAMAALPRPHMQRELVLLARRVAGGKIGNTRLPEGDIGKRRRAWRLVIYFRAAKRCTKRAIGDERIVYGGAQRCRRRGGHGNLVSLRNVVSPRVPRHRSRGSGDRRWGAL